MHIEDLREVRACLPTGRTLFHYEQNRFAVMILHHLQMSGWTASDIRRSAFARLSSRPPIKEFLAHKGHADINQQDLASLPWLDPVPWRLTVGSWGRSQDYSWCQTSRKGTNLVLQLNFCNAHNERYRELVAPDGEDVFNYRGHPVASGELTLAWVRLDFDFQTGEALIEEVQSDWVRRIPQNRTAILTMYAAMNRRCERVPGRLGTPARFRNSVEQYRDQILPPYTKNWQETALAAALYFLVHELGMSSIFMHEFDTGNQLKNLANDYSKPPRSIYTHLPRSFCFEKTNRRPAFLQREVRKLERGKRAKKLGKDPSFWHMNLQHPPCTNQLV